MFDNLNSSLDKTPQSEPPPIATPKDKPHILMLVRDASFPPSKNAPAARLGSFAKYWSELTPVTVLSSQYALPKANYSRVCFPLTQKGFDFLRIPYLFPRLSHFITRLNIDLIFVSFPLAWELLEAYLLAFRCRCPLVVDIRDLPVGELPVGDGSIFRRSFNALMHYITYYVSKKATLMGTVTECLQNDLINILGCNRKKISVIRNGSETSFFKKAFDVQKKFDIIYAGAFFELRNPAGMLRYFRTLTDIYPAFRGIFVSNLYETPIGQEFLANLKRIGLEQNITVENRVPLKKLPEKLGSARLGLNAILPDYQAHKGAVGAKEYDYLAAGLPVIGLMDPNFYVESGRLIVKNKVGILSQAPEVLARETAALLKDKKRLQEMSKRARKVGERFDRKRLAEDYFYKVILPAYRAFNTKK